MNLEKGTFGIFPAEMLAGKHPIQQTVMAWLWTYKNSEGVCWPSQKTLCEKAWIGQSALNAHLAILERDGLVIRERRNGESGTNESTVYSLPILRNTEYPTPQYGVPYSAIRRVTKPIEPNQENLSIVEKKKDGIEEKIEKVREASPELADAIAAYVEHRKTKRAKITPSGFDLLLKKLSKISGNDVATAVEILEQSVANWWTGIFDLKNGTQRKQERHIPSFD